jgi:hypothetical protein
VNPRASLGIVRLALLGGVLAFGAASWFIQRQPGWMPAPPELLRVASTAVRAAWVVAFVGLVIAYVLAQRRKGPSDGRHELVGWALGESTAVVGGVYYFFSGDPHRYGWGVAGLLLTFVIFPIPSDRT